MKEWKMRGVNILDSTVANMCHLLLLHYGADSRCFVIMGQA